MIMIMFLLYDHKANILKHAQDLRYTEITAPILITVNTTYNGYEIRDADLFVYSCHVNHLIL